MAGNTCEWVKFVVDYGYGQKRIISTSIKVVVGPKRLTNRNLKQIITIQCTKTVKFQLLRPLDISKLVERGLMHEFIIKWV